MARLGRYRLRNRRHWLAASSRSLLAALLLLPLLAGCSGSTGTAGWTGAATGSEAAGPTDGQRTAETTAGSADGAAAGPVCTDAKQETIGGILDLTPAGAPESIEDDPDPLVLIGAPRALVSFTGCSLPFTGAGIDPDQELTVDIYSANGGHDDFERIRRGWNLTAA